MAAEFVVADYLGVPMPQRYDTKIETDGGIGDLVLPNGKTVSVKLLSRQEDPWGLYSADPSGFRDDYGVLVWKDGPRFIIVGWFDRTMWEEHWRHHRYSPNLPERAVIDFIWMRPIDQLKAEVDRIRGV